MTPHVAIRSCNRRYAPLVPAGIEKAGTLLLRSVPAYVLDQQEENA